METEELLGSVTTYTENEQTNASSTRPAPIRTSARVIKKLRQDVSQTNNVSNAEPPDKKDFAKSSDVDKAEKENIQNQTEKDKISSKPRMPKAVWSTMEKNLFFEALNEFGKDFDAITAHICNKMKRKGGTNNNIKTKQQVSHFYYRTWHKVSKHIQFDSNVKKVAQELYALINYGEIRKRLVSGVVSKVVIPTRLPELVKKGVVALRAKGRTLRVRTPMCRALRKLNKIEEWDEQLRLPLRVCVQILARDSDSWTKVQSLAHNPRVLAPVAPSCRLGTLLTILNRKWMPADQIIRESLISGQKKDLFTSVDTQISYLINPNAQCNLTAEFEKMTNTAELSSYKANLVDKKDSISKGSLSVVSKSDDNLNLEENVQKSSSSINNSNDKDDIIKNSIKTANEANCKAENPHNTSSNPSNSIEHSVNNKDNEGITKGDDCLVDNNHINRIPNQFPKGSILHVGPKPGVFLNLPVINISEHVTSQRICLTSYQERLEHDSLNNQADCFKGGVRFKSQKRQRKDSGELDAAKKSKSESFNFDKTDVFDIDETANDGMDMTATLAELKTSAIKMILPSDDKSNEDLNDGREKDIFSELEDDDKCNNETDGENDLGLKNTKENLDDGKAGKLTSARKLKFPPVKEQNDVVTVEKNPNNLLDSPEENVNTNKPATNPSEFFKKNWNRDLLQGRIKKGWNIHDSGDLTIGDLYLMFGSNSKLELNYWWSEASPQISNLSNQQSSITSSPNNDTARQKPIKENEIIDLDNILSPKPANTVNDEADIKKSEKEETEITEEMSSPDSKHNPDQDPSAGSTYHLISKLGINTVPNDDQKTDFPWSVPQRDKLLTATERLKKLLSIFQLHSAKGNEGPCRCCHPCGKGKKVPMQNKDDSNPTHVIIANMTIPNNESEADMQNDVFRTPFTRGLLLPNPDKKAKETFGNLNFKSMPPWTRRGKKCPKRAPHHVVVKQFLPILPKPNQPQMTKTPSAPAPIVRVLPALRPKPSPKTIVKTERPATSLIKEEELHLPYDGELSDSENMYKSPSFKNALSNSENSSSLKKDIKSDLPSLTTLSNERSWSSGNDDKKLISEASLSNMLDISLPSNLIGEDSILNGLKSVRSNLAEKTENFAGFWNPSESLSMSPSRLLKENDDHWIDTEVNNFSLSSFLGHLEAPTLANSVKTEPSNIVNETENEHFTENLSAGIL